MKIHMSQSLKHREGPGGARVVGIPRRKDEGRDRDKAVLGTAHRQDCTGWEENGMLRLDQIMEVMGYHLRKSGLNCVGIQESWQVVRMNLPY